MADIKQVLLDLDKFKDRSKVVSQLMRRAAFVIMSDVVQGSPVDTGRFQSSWFVGIGEPNRTVGDVREGPGNASGESLGRLSALTPATVKGDRPIIISNNLPYAEELANGHSTKAPSGWVDAAAMRAENELSKIRVL